MRSTLINFIVYGAGGGLLLCSGAAAGDSAAVRLTIGGGTVVPGGAVAVSVDLALSDAAPAAIVLLLTVDPAALTLASVEPGPAANGHDAAFEQTASGFGIVLYGGPGPMQPGHLITLVLEAPSDAAPASITPTDAGSSASDATPVLLPISVAALPIVIAAPAQVHTADANGNHRIELSELLRVIQFFNAGSFGCDGGTEDGYAPGAYDPTCAVHDSDYSNQDWRIDLGELLRIIQFFTAFGGSYHPDASGEDGFAPGPAP